MPRAPIKAPEQNIPMTFPVNGIDLSMGFENQRGGTTPTGQNVRAYEPSTNRQRGGSRPGLTKYMPVVAVAAGAAIQELSIGVATIPTGSGNTALPGSGVQIVDTNGNPVVTVNSGDLVLASMTDGNGYFYTVSLPSPFNLASYLTKYDRQGNIIWRVPGYDDQDESAGANDSVTDIVDMGSTIGVLVNDATDSANYIIQGDKATGTILNSNWFATPNATPSQKLTSRMSRVGTTLIFGNQYVAGTNVIFYFLNVTTGAVIKTLASADIDPSFTSPSVYRVQCTTTNGTNFFSVVVSAATPSSDTIYEANIMGYTPAGVLNLNSVLANRYAVTMDYDVANNVLLVGFTATDAGAAYTLATYDPATGALLNTNNVLASVNKVVSDGRGGIIAQASDGTTSHIYHLASIAAGATDWTKTTTLPAAGYYRYPLATDVANFMSAGQSFGINVRRLAVSNGTIARFDSLGPIAIAGGVGALSSTANVVYSGQVGQYVFFIDGTNYVVYDLQAGTVYPMVATAGSLPKDSRGNAARLMCVWRNRLCFSGLPYDPYNWFFSALGNPFDFNYFPLVVTPSQAIRGADVTSGEAQDIMMTMVPYTNDVMVMGLSHSIYIMNGDPMAGGQIDLVSDVIGMAFGQPWCKDPLGQIYFMSNQAAIWTLIPGQQPQRVSQGIGQLVNPVSISNSVVRMSWDNYFQGVHVFVTPASGAAATSHLFYETRTGAWWQDKFANNNHNPLCCYTYFGDLPADRSTLIGSFDGYVRQFSDLAATDDGTPIQSTVMIGPLLTKQLEDLTLKDLQAHLGATSGPVSYNIFVGPTAELALSAGSVASGTWVAGRNPNTFIRRAGHATWVQLSATSPWSFEAIRARIQGQGKVRMRSAT